MISNVKIDRQLAFEPSKDKRSVLMKLLPIPHWEKIRLDTMPLAFVPRNVIEAVVHRILHKRWQVKRLPTEYRFQQLAIVRD